MTTTRTQLADLTQDQLDWLYDGINQAAREALAQRREMRQITRSLTAARAYAADNASQLAQDGHAQLLHALGVRRPAEDGQA
ncbi:hypothetical protein ACFV5N_09320 [Streptomyces sp. NPDC059853]|uniref:hypothetical protein n=1 Tax=Streptomyces sp. NPDC059853 TaxID=3346973 RepID=UPI0036468C10